MNPERWTTKSREGYDPARMGVSGEITEGDAIQVGAGKSGLSFKTARRSEAKAS